MSRRTRSPYYGAVNLDAEYVADEDFEEDFEGDAPDDTFKPKGTSYSYVFTKDRQNITVDGKYYSVIERAGDDGQTEVWDTMGSGRRLGIVNPEGKFKFDKQSEYDAHKERIADYSPEELKAETKQRKERQRELRAERKAKEEEERRQRQIVEGNQALEDVLAEQRQGLEIVRRNRQRVPGSWRDQDKGACWTRRNANGGAYVVCEEGSRGQKGVYQKVDREDRGDPDQKGRDKTAAIQKNRVVMRKYDDEGKVIPISEGEKQYFTPLRKEGDSVVLAPTADGAVGKSYGLTDQYKNILEKRHGTIRVPIDEFNAQFRVTKGLDEPGDKYDTLLKGSYELDEEMFYQKTRKKKDPDDVEEKQKGLKETGRMMEDVREEQEEQEARSAKAIQAIRDKGGITGIKQAIRRTREDRERFMEERVGAANIIQERVRERQTAKKAKEVSVRERGQILAKREKEENKKLERESKEAARAEINERKKEAMEYRETEDYEDEKEEEQENIEEYETGVKEGKITKIEDNPRYKEYNKFLDEMVKYEFPEFGFEKTKPGSKKPGYYTDWNPRTGNKRAMYRLRRLKKGIGEGYGRFNRYEYLDVPISRPKDLIRDGLATPDMDDFLRIDLDSIMTKISDFLS